MRAQGECVVHRYQNKNPLGMWMTSCTGSARGGFWEIWKSQLSCVLRSEEEGDFRLLAEALWQVPHMLGGRWKNQNRKNVYLSPYVEEPLNSKVIKCFVPELRSRKCFSCFRIPMFYVYMLWTFYVCFTYPYLVMVHNIKNDHWLFRHAYT